MNTTPTLLAGPIPASVRRAAQVRSEALAAGIEALRLEQAALAAIAAPCWDEDEPLCDVLARVYLATSSATKTAALMKAAGVRIAGRRNDTRVLMAADVQALVAGRACDVPGTVSSGLRDLLRRRASAAAAKRGWSA